MYRTRRYAQNTRVPIDRSRGEIERYLTARGATGVGYYSGDDRADVLFAMRGYRVRMSVPMTVPVKRGDRAELARRKQDQERRRRWRALLLSIKAKISAVEAGIVEFHEEFMPFIVTGDGKTIYEQATALGFGLVADRGLALPPGRE